MIVLGIETSCDETAVGIVKDGDSLLAECVSSSIALHIPYGGVVPEVAARSHIEVMIPVIQQALSDSNLSWNDIDAIAVTYGAGLGGSLLIGVLTARTLSLVFNKPLFAINHIEAHIYANFLKKTALKGYTLPSETPEFPLLALTVSGGHSQLVLLQGHFKYQILGQTQDDAIGEAFDKVAKMLGLPYPGGPSIAKLAENGDPLAYSFPKAKMSKYDLSFSGLKTAVLRRAQAEIGESYDFPSIKLAERLSEAQKANIAASFQYVAIQTIVDKTKLACQEFQPRALLVAGGVAANTELRRQLCEALDLPLFFPDIKLCTDNGAMVATLGCLKAMQAQPKADPLSLDIAPSLTL